MINDAQSNLYGWTCDSATAAHSYLWPAIQGFLPYHVGREPARILDLGCGNGYIASRLYALGYRVVGIDQSPDGIAIARQAYPEIRFEAVSVYDDLIHQLGERNFDVVVSSEVIEHLYYPRRLLQNASSLLKLGGVVIITTPYHGYLKNLTLSLLDKWDDHHAVHWDGGHIKFFSERTLTVMLEGAGFTGIRFKNAGRLPWVWKSIVCRAERAASA